MVAFVPYLSLIVCFLRISNKSQYKLKPEKRDLKGKYTGSYVENIKLHQSSSGFREYSHM